MKILIIRLSSIGDIVLTTALIRQLKNQIKEAEIDYVVSKQFSDLLKFNPHITRLLEYDKSLSAFNLSAHKKLFGNPNLNHEPKTTNPYHYDIVIDLHNNLRTRCLTMIPKGKLLRLKKHPIRKLSLVYFKKIPSIEKMESLSSHKLNLFSIPDVYSEAIIELGIQDDGKGLEIWLPEETGLSTYPPESRINPLPTINTSKLSTTSQQQSTKIGIAPGAFHFTKRWLPDRFISLINVLAQKYDCQFTLFGGKQDKDLCSYIQMNAVAKVRNIAGITTLIETTRYIDECHLLISNDTGLMHIAAGRQVPVVAIFGSTVTQFGFAPFRTPNIIVEKEVGCRPCTHIGRSRCPKGHFNCMNLITADDVLQACTKLISVD